MYEYFDFDYENAIFEWDEEKQLPISPGMVSALKLPPRYLPTKTN